MALIVCPECAKQVSSAATACPNCGFPIADHLATQRASEEKIAREREESAMQSAFDAEVKRLQDQILPCEYKCREPRVQVCIRCGKPFRYVPITQGYVRDCRCSHDDLWYPSVEVDYSIGAKNLFGFSDDLYILADASPEYRDKTVWNGCGDRLYILNQCVIPRHIGDPDAPEYKEYVSTLNAMTERENELLEHYAKQYDEVEAKTSFFRKASAKTAGQAAPKVEEIPPDPSFLSAQETTPARKEPSERERVARTRARNKLYDEIVENARTSYNIRENARIAAQMLTAKELSSANIPTCPICHSTNLTKISQAGSFVKIAAIGIAGAGDVGKTWKCNNCGSKF